MLKEGDLLPNFSLPDQNGQERNIKEFLGKGSLVLFFYPKDFTPGCTKQACGLRDEFDELHEAGIEVVGISSDGPKRHKKFSDRYQLPFVLLSDIGNKIRDQFGLKARWLGFLPRRTTFIINQEGVIQAALDAQFEVEHHLQLVRAQKK